MYICVIKFFTTVLVVMYTTKHCKYFAFVNAIVHFGFFLRFIRPAAKGLDFVCGEKTVYSTILAVNRQERICDCKIYFVFRYWVV